jgi:hypothetical protein
MAGGTGTLAATIAIDTRHTVVGGRAHQVLANGGLDAAAHTAEADEMDLGHG